MKISNSVLKFEQNWTLLSLVMKIDISVLFTVTGCSSELGVNWSMGRQNI